MSKVVDLKTFRRQREAEAEAKERASKVLMFAFLGRLRNLPDDVVNGSRQKLADALGWNWDTVMKYIARATDEGLIAPPSHGTLRERLDAAKSNRGKR